ncbi:MAG: hypothetical protein ACPGUV_10085 [Polyangiales bacterium]
MKRVAALATLALFLGACGLLQDEGTEASATGGAEPAANAISDGPVEQPFDSLAQGLVVHWRFAELSGSRTMGTGPQQHTHDCPCWRLWGVV